MMNWFKQLLGIPEQKKSASIAKERLMVIVAHERGEHPEQPDFLPLLEKELTEVIAKYVNINKDQVQVEFEQRGGRSVLELNVTLPGLGAVVVAPTAPVKAPVSAKSKPAAAKTTAPKKRGRPPKAK